MTGKGLEGIVAAESSICFIDGIKGELAYRGYSIHDLAQQSTFEEVCHLLWKGVLPDRSKLQELRGQLAAARDVPGPIVDILRRLPTTTTPIVALRTGISAAGCFDPEAENNAPEANFRKSVRLTSLTTGIVGAFHRIRNGLDPVVPDRDLSHAGYFLQAITGKRPQPAAERTIDVSLILHADHGLNASTFAARVTIATLSDIYSAITSAIGALKGPLHGGANEGVLDTLMRIGSVDRVESYLTQALEHKEKIMGFGHRVYKTLDPRAIHLRRMSGQLGKEMGDTKWYDMSVRMQEFMKKSKNLDANVDFYSATTYHALGIPKDLFTPIFACSRISGWTANVLEQLADNRLIRPDASYIGPMNLAYVPLEKRS